MDLLRSVVLLVHRGDAGATFGTGVFLSDSVILTARHVVDPDLLSVRGGMPDSERVRVQSAAFGGERVADALEFPEDGNTDLAFVHLHAPKNVKPDFRCRVWRHWRGAVSTGDEVQVAGHSSLTGDRQLDLLRVIGVHGHAGAWLTNRFLPRGYSGGPVFCDGALVGVLYARSTDQNHTYFHGGELLQQWIARLPASGLDWREETPDALREYPLGPAVTDVFDRLGLVIRAYTKLYSGDQALLVVGAANSARRRCGPDTQERGLLSHWGYPDPRHNPVGFWMAAFDEAGRKSPRMLAALLHAVDPVQLDMPSRQQRESTLQELATLAGAP